MKCYFYRLLLVYRPAGPYDGAVAAAVADSNRDSGGSHQEPGGNIVSN